MSDTSAPSPAGTSVTDPSGGGGSAPGARVRTAGTGVKIGATTSVAVSSGRSSTYDALVVSTDSVGSIDHHTYPTDAALPVGFTDRVGDPVAMIDDSGQPYAAEDVYVDAISALLAQTGDDTEVVVVACPNGWRPVAIDALRTAADARGLSDLTVVPEAIACVAAAQATSGGHIGPETGDRTAGHVAVYDLGGSTLDIAIVATGDESQIVGRPLRSDEISGEAFDQAVLAHVVRTLDLVDAIDPFDPDTLAALARLRTTCARAKEALSSDTDTVVSVELLGVHTDIRLVRSEVEDLFRDDVLASITLLREAISAAGITPRDVSAVILAGGGAAIPLITEMLSATLRIPVIVDADPETMSAFGAAVLANEIGAAGAALDAMPVNAAAVAAELAAARSADLVPSGSDRPRGAPARAIEPAPRTAVPAGPSRASRGRRFAIIGGVAAAIALITAGGLSVGTALSSNDSPSPARPSASSPAPGAPVTGGARSAEAGRTADNGASPNGSGAGRGGGANSDARTGTAPDRANGSGPRGSGSGGTGSQGSGGTGQGSANPGSGGAGQGSGGTGSGNTGGGSTGGGSAGGGTGNGSGGTGSGDSGGTAPPETNGRPTIPTIPRPAFPQAGIPGLGDATTLPGRMLNGTTNGLTTSGDGN